MSGWSSAPATIAPDDWTPEDVAAEEFEHPRKRRDKATVPSAGSLRGLPVIGHGGAIRGTDPLRELIRRERRG